MRDKREAGASLFIFLLSFKLISNRGDTQDEVNKE